jgi:hypothetical protein
MRRPATPADVRSLSGHSKLQDPKRRWTIGELLDSCRPDSPIRLLDGRLEELADAIRRGRWRDGDIEVRVTSGQEVHDCTHRLAAWLKVVEERGGHVDGLPRIYLQDA